MLFQNHNLYMKAKHKAKSFEQWTREASSGFDVTKPHEFEQMIRILKEQKRYIETELGLL